MKGIDESFSGHLISVNNLWLGFFLLGLSLRWKRVNPVSHWTQTWHGGSYLVCFMSMCQRIKKKKKLWAAATFLRTRAKFTHTFTNFGSTSYKLILHRIFEIYWWQSFSISFLIRSSMIFFTLSLSG